MTASPMCRGIIKLCWDGPEIAQMHRRAFTLIELLVVITVIGILMSMLMPVVSMVNRLARTTATRSVMVKVDSAARLFRNDIGSYPWQASYADLAAGASWTNRLFYHLGTDVDLTNLTKLHADAKAAAAMYAYDKNAPAASPQAFIPADLQVGSPGGGPTAMLNRMAAERTRMAIYAGNASIPGCVLQRPWKANPTYVRRIVSTAPLLAAPFSAAKPGWAKDYLRGELEKKYIDNETILDAWRHPLIYVGQIVEGMAPAPVESFMGLPCNSLRSVEFGLHPLGRRTLAAFDAISEEPLAVDAAYLPNLSNLRHSDRRFYAAPGNELEFELWSAGPDGKADWMRDTRVNNDNVPLTPYDLRIP